MGAIFTRQNPYKWLGAQTSAQNVVPASAGFAPATTGYNKRLVLEYAELQNRNTGTLNAALVGLLPDAMWHLGTLAAADGAYTDDTTDAQDAGAGDVPLEAKTGNANSGFMIGASMPWGAASLNVGTAGIGSSQEHTYKYWDGASWATLTPVLIAGPTAAGELWASGENVLLFDPPVDWAVGGTPTATVPQTEYNVQVVMTVDGSTDALLTRAFVGVVLFSSKTIAAAPGSYSVGPGSEIELPGYIVGVNGAFSTITIPNKVTLIGRFTG